ncbi:basic proline-rich protein-like [Macrobrachium nipponense]|uniref:basic proline-rich protein-like n=1 Tax=Macrobrachium nipponense TaxID=159736 RepID=UPI0030C7BF9E
MSGPAHLSWDTWQALPARPRTHGGPCPPIPGLVAGPARPSQDIGLPPGPGPSRNAVGTPLVPGSPGHPVQPPPPAHPGTRVSGPAPPFPAMGEGGGHRGRASPRPIPDPWQGPPLPSGLGTKRQGLRLPSLGHVAGPYPPCLSRDDVARPHPGLYPSGPQLSQDTYWALPARPKTRRAPRPPVPDTWRAPPTCPRKRGGPRPPVPGHMAGLACLSRDAWRASPTCPGTRGGPQPPVLS